MVDLSIAMLNYQRVTLIETLGYVMFSPPYHSTLHHMSMVAQFILAKTKNYGHGKVKPS